MNHRCGAIAVIGKPNVGKSTLVNQLVGQKVSIVSNKRQTTRSRILGILSEPDFQLALLDTPGMHEPHTHLGRIMNDAAKGALAEVDMILFVADCSKPPQDEDRAIAELVEAVWKYPHAQEHPGFNGIILCLNKMDLLRAEFVKENVEAYCELFGTEEYMLTCLTKKQNAEKLLEMIVARLPQGDSQWPEDEFTDQPMRRLAAELIREKALRLTKQEVPHAIATVVEMWEPEPERDRVRITASIVVEKDGQKAIMIGKQGAMLKQIGTESRIEIEDILGQRVYLELVVKVRPEWRQNPRMLHDLEIT